MSFIEKHYYEQKKTLEWHKTICSHFKSNKRMLGSIVTTIVSQQTMVLNFIGNFYPSWMEWISRHSSLSRLAQNLLIWVVDCSWAELFPLSFSLILFPSKPFATSVHQLACVVAVVVYCLRKYCCCYSTGRDRTRWYSKFDSCWET